MYKTKRPPPYGRGLKMKQWAHGYWPKLVTVGMALPRLVHIDMEGSYPERLEINIVVVDQVKAIKDDASSR